MMENPLQGLNLQPFSYQPDLLTAGPHQTNHTVIKAKEEKI